MTMRLMGFVSLLMALVLLGCHNTGGPKSLQPATIPEAAATTVARTPATTPATAPVDLQNVQVMQRITEDPGRMVVRLTNGLSVILQENHTAPVVAARIYIKAGSLTEQEYMGSGISHVLEHLVAGGSSASLKESDSQQALRILGGDSNAFTSFDRTCYFITTTAEKWPLALELLTAWTTRADFTAAEFRREYQVVQREIEMGEAEAARSFYKLIYANRYLVFPARHPVIGYKPAFQKLTWQDCRTYYKRMYVPDNMIVSIAGDIDLAGALKLVQQRFSQVQRSVVPSISLPTEPAVTGTRLAVAHGDVKRARVQWGFPTVDMYDPDMYPLDVLANILASGESSILIRTLRDQKQLVTSIHAGNDTPHWAAGQLEIIAELPPRNIAAAQRALLEIVESIKTNGVGLEQVQKARAQVAAGLVYGNQTAEQQAERNAGDFLVSGNIDYSRMYVERIAQVTPDQVRDAARKYLKPECLLTTILLPNNAPDELAGLTAAAKTSTVRPTVEMVTLPNGLRVLIGRNPAATIVSFQYYTLGALLAENDANNGIGNALMELLPRGTTTRSYDEITGFLDATGGELDASMGNNTFTVKATALRLQAQPTFLLFADVLLHPALSQPQLDEIRPLLLASIERATEDWFGEGYRFLRASYYQDSPYVRLPSGKAEVVSKLTPEQIRAHYKKYLLNPRQSVLAVYGDIDPEQVKQWITQLGQIPAPATPPTLALVSMSNPAKTVTQNSAKGSASVFFGYGPGMLVTSPDRHAMAILQTILGGYNSPGGSVLHETLRGQGLVYTVQASNIAGPVPGMFLIMALGQPENTGKITTLVNKIAADAKAGSFTEEQIATAKDQAITGEHVRDQTIAAQAASAALDELMGLGYQARQKIAENLRQVTREDVKRVANKYLQEPVIAITTPAGK